MAANLNLDENARAVASVNFRAHRSAMIKVQENLKSVLDDLVRFFSFDVSDETDPASVVLELGVIQALLWGKASDFRPAVFLFVAHLSLGNLVSHRRFQNKVC